MDETTVPALEPNGHEIQPVEIKFGDVVQFIHREGERPSRPYVVVDHDADNYIYAAGVISDDDADPDLGGIGTFSAPAVVIGNWSYEKIEKGWKNHYPQDYESITDDLLENSQKPPVMYKGQYDES